MTRMAERGKAKFEARKARWIKRAESREKSPRARVGREAWERLERLFRKEGDHGAASKERLLEFVADRFGQDADRAQFILWELAKHLLRQADPLAELNRQINEAEKAPVIDKSWTEAPVAAPEGGK